MIKAVVLDLDGVVVLGQAQVEGAAQAIGKLKGMGLRIAYLSNNSSMSREGLCAKLNRLGVPAELQEVYPSSYAVANYIAKNYPGKSVYALTTGGIDEELAKKGVKIVHDETAEVVAAGLDKNITFQKITIAFRAIRAGAPFIASNEDMSYPVENGKELPGAGATTGALRHTTGAEPILVGKPSPYMFEMILADYNITKAEAIYVGDRLDVDIEMGKRAGVRTALVLTGIAKKKDIAPSPAKPDFVANSIAAIPALVEKLNMPANG
jgi:phosphoglycolate/pyridoxal phosphate phosphatase family enzyme